jgi:TetR/AcrR family transcriptional regulator, transcriptional repressor for nem operon
LTIVWIDPYNRSVPVHETRSQIVDTAARLIYEQGYAATGVSQILAASGTGSSSLYHHFRSKEDLLVAVLDRYLERLDEEIVGPSRAATADPIERVFRILGFYRTLLEATGCRLGCPIGNLAGEVSDTHPRVRDKLVELFAAWRRAVERCLREAAPRLRPDVDPGEVAVFVLAVMEGGVMQARVERSLRPFEISVERLRDYLRSLTTEPRPEEATP